jgi:hypothetical protein
MKFATKLLLLILLASVTAAAKKHDPLTEAESDQLREVAMLPYERIKLLIKFTEERLTSIDQVRVDPKTANDRGKQIHDLLEDFTSLVDETNDNLDQFEARKLDKDLVKRYHKGLKELIDADDRFQLRLKALREAAENDPQFRKYLPDFRFVLQDAEDSVKSSEETAREYIEVTHEDKSEGKKK